MQFGLAQKKIRGLDFYHIWRSGGILPHSKSLAFTFLQIQKINYEGKLPEIQKLLNAWSKRHLTPLGKIAVIKSLVVSKITYLTMNIPDPTEGFIQELEKKLFDFLWNGKKDKMKEALSSF